MNDPYTSSINENDNTHKHTHSFFIDSDLSNLYSSSHKLTHRNPIIVDEKDNDQIQRHTSNEYSTLSEPSFSSQPQSSIFSFGTLQSLIHILMSNNKKSSVRYSNEEFMETTLAIQPLYYRLFTSRYYHSFMISFFILSNLLLFYEYSIQNELFFFILTKFILILLTFYSITLGITRQIPIFYFYFDLHSYPKPSQDHYSESLDLQEIKRNIRWVPFILALNYVCVFIWYSFFKIMLNTSNLSLKTFYFYLFIYILSSLYTSTVLHYSCLYMDKHFYQMTCNLILIFLSGIIATTFNNFTHFLHQPGDMLPDIGFHFIPEVTGIQTEFSNIILVSFIALCILLSLFCQSDVRNKMWCDFGRIASIMIVTKGFLGWMTLLPGPAPHCRPYAMNYPPTDVMEIFTHQVLSQFLFLWS